MFRRLSILCFGGLTYVMFLGVFLYAAAFVCGLPVPKTMNGPTTYPMREALPVNVALVLLFGLQHSVMARPGFKRWWTQFVPASVERNVYVLATNVALILLFWLWRPVDMFVWNWEHPALQILGWSVGIAGWLTVLVTTFLINHFDLFGLRQAWTHFRGREYKPLRFVTPGPYRWVRHPLYVGWLMAFWGTPVMSAMHLVFAVGMTIYILIAIQFEERDLVQYHGEDYAIYRRQVPMLIPAIWKR
ncbi:MAG TPA: isoprenylcysteine carboxylmethyltransferase family protein [Pirellulaceae bacterium]|nr:isoprenylcysteine carboxylmethyltransferase family protein [Pirellulaceae bacterium]